jgi:hypothetical protein
MSVSRLVRSCAWVSVAALAACGPAAEPKAPGAPSACAGAKLAACERDLAKAVLAGNVSAKAVAAYVEGRAAADAEDPWAKLWAELSKRDAARAAIVDARPGAAPISIEGARVAVTGKLSEPGNLSPAELLLAMGDAAGYEHVVWLGAGPDGKQSYEIYPHDPLAPLVFGVLGVARDDGEPAHLAKNLELAATVRRAFDAAGTFHYAAAAKEAASITEQLRDRDRFEEPVLRARYAFALLDGAGLVLSPQPVLFGPSVEEPKIDTTPPPPADTDTAYGDMLRVRTNGDGTAEWKRRGAHVLAAIAEDRRKMVDDLFQPAVACAAPALPPSFDRPGDLGLIHLLPDALDGAKTPPIAGPARGNLLPFAAWFARYEAAEALVEKARLGWLEVPALVRQRGEIAGLSSSGTGTYRRVTEMGLRHLAGLRELLDTDPDQYSLGAELAVAYSPGLLADEKLRGALVDLTQATTRAKVARSEDPPSILGSLFVGFLSGLTYPPALQEPYYLALQGAFAAKVKGEMTKRTGWGPAALFALDAIVRVIADQGPNLQFSSDQIARALSDPAIALPNVAAVVSAVARYAALAKDRPLAALATLKNFTPERAAAREALRKAIVDMGAPGEAPAQLADDLATLADGLVATLSILLHEKPAPKGTCAKGEKSAADIEIAHALTNLRPVRQKLLASPHMKGDGVWQRRARLLVALLSDAMDFAEPRPPSSGSKGSKKKKSVAQQLTLSSAEVESAIAGALREWDEPGAVDAIIGVYSFARFVLQRDQDSTIEKGGPYMLRALRGLGRFVTGSDPKRSRLLDAISEMAARPNAPASLLGAVLGFTKLLYEKGDADLADLFLLGASLMRGQIGDPPGKDAFDLAASNRSRVDWALRMLSEVNALETNGRPDVAAFADGARKAAEEKCAEGRVDDVVAAVDAVAKFTNGQRKEAREALDRLLARADAEGMVLPALQHKYSEKHQKRIFTIQLGMTYGLGFIRGGNSFQFGLGFSSISDSGSKVAVTAMTPEETAKDTGEYYVRVAALAAAYAFLDGDAASAAVHARRVVSAAVSGVRLGARSITEGRKKWVEDSQALIAVVAQLAAEAGYPFLSGDLWTIVKDSFEADADDEAVADALPSAPRGLIGVKEAEPVIERAKKSIKVVGGPLACTKEKVETAAYEQPACAAYPLALGLRIADVVKKLPRLKRGPENDQGSCAALKALDVFLDSAQRGTYDPDAFTQAVEALRADGRVDEAASLLIRQRRENHCSPTLLKATRALGRSPLLLPSARSDMLSIAVNCAGADGGADLEKDLFAIDEETRKLPDPTRNIKLLFFVAELSLRADKPSLLLPLVKVPGFTDRFLSLSGNAVAGALLLHHAAHLLNGEAWNPAHTQGTFALVCESFPADERRATCSDLRSLRDPDKPAAARKDLAKAALSRLLEPAEKPAAKQP